MSVFVCVGPPEGVLGERWAEVGGAGKLAGRV